jgi:hypothetical protein
VASVRYKALILAMLVFLGVAAGYIALVGLSASNHGSSPAAQGLAFAEPVTSGNGPWTVSLQGANGASSPITITQFSVDGIDFSAQVASPGLPMTVQPGGSFLLSVAVATGGGVTYSSGEALTLGVTTSAGETYSAHASLPLSTASNTQPGGAGSGGIEKLVLTPSVIGGALNVTALNESPGTVTVKQVFFNDVPAVVTFGSGFSQSGTGQLPSDATGTFTVATSGAVSGVMYDIVVITAAGNSFSAVVQWP